MNRIARYDIAEEVGLDAGDGVSALLGGIGFVLVSPRVWGYAAVPVLIALLLACGLGGLGVWAAFEAAAAVVGEPASAWGQAGHWGIVLSVGLTAVLLAALVSLVLAQPLSGWALEAICRAQERSLVGACSPEPSLLASLWIALRVSAFTLLVGTSCTAALMAVNFIFPPAVVVTVPLKFLLLSWLLAWNFLDYPLGLRGLGILARFGWAWRHLGAFTSFGACWAMILVIPGMLLFLLPLGVAGATRLVVAGSRAGAE